MRYAFIAEQKLPYSLTILCRVLRVSRSGYYAWKKRPESCRVVDNQHLVTRIRQIHKESWGTYGSPRVHRQLRLDGMLCSRGRVERLMSSNRIYGQSRRRFVVTTDSKHTLPVSPNILDRKFSVMALDRVWVSDITYIPTNEGWLYLAGVLDLCSRRIVGWSMSKSLERSVVMDALTMAYRHRKPGQGLIHHADRGCQYASQDYQSLLASYGMQSSMSRKGDCWDNAPMESFFATLKKELVHGFKFRTREEARRMIFEYIEVFYNRQRLHSSLGYVSPATFEQQLAAKQAA